MGREGGAQVLLGDEFSLAARRQGQEQVRSMWGEPSSSRGCRCVVVRYGQVVVIGAGECELCSSPCSLGSPSSQRGQCASLTQPPSSEHYSACSIGFATLLISHPGPSLPWAHCLTPPPLIACSIGEVLHNIDISIQFGEDAEVKVRDFDEAEEAEAEGCGDGGEDA